MIKRRIKQLSVDKGERNTKPSMTDPSLYETLPETILRIERTGLVNNLRNLQYDEDSEDFDVFAFNRPDYDLIDLKNDEDRLNALKEKIRKSDLEKQRIKLRKEIENELEIDNRINYRDTDDSPRDLHEEQKESQSAV
jgi:hypothetical protein